MCLRSVKMEVLWDRDNFFVESSKFLSSVSEDAAAGADPGIKNEKLAGEVPVVVGETPEGVEVQGVSFGTTSNSFKLSAGGEFGFPMVDDLWK